MLHPSTKRLIDKLGDMTRRQRVTWQEAEDGQMTHDTEGYRVTLTPEPYAVLLTDAQGREIETCSPSDVADEFDSEGRPYAVFVEELYREAKRHARGAEAAISAVLAGLTAVEVSAEDTPADLVENAAGPDTETLDIAPGAPAVEDPLDDSSPLEPEAYWEMDSQSDITSAVASLANQVNTPLAINPVDLEALEDISEDAPDELTESPEESVACTVDNAHVGEEPEASEEDGPETATSDTPIMGYGVGSPEEPAALEPVAQPGPLNGPAAGFTPTGFAETTPDMAVEAEARDKFASYAPAFSDTHEDAPAYAQAEPFDNFTSEPEKGEFLPEFPMPETRFAPTEDTAESMELDMDNDVQPAPAGQMEEHASGPSTQESGPSPAPQENFLTSSSSLLAGGFGGSLSRYTTEPDSAQELMEPEPADVPTSTYEAAGTPEVETQFEAAPEPEAEPEPASASDTSPTPLPSFSLSGIGARQVPVGTPAPPEASDPVESVTAPQVVIDATHDQPWPGSEPTGLDEPALAPDMQFEAPEPRTETGEEIAAEPDFMVGTLPETVDARADDEPEIAEEAPPRPVKRFNPWN
jgi:hypothetical protein